MNIIDLETPKATEKYYAPKTEDESPFYITEYGKTFSGTPCYQLRLHSPIACVQYVLSGSGVLLCNDRIFTVRAGDTFLLTEGMDQIYYSNPDNCFERVWLNFKGELSRSLLSVYGIENTVVFPSTNSEKLMNEIIDTCKANKNPKEYKTETAPLFLRLVQLLAENKNKAFVKPSPVEKIRLYIDRNITKHLTIDTLAEKFSYSKEHIIRTFSALYGITPHKYIVQAKIRSAMIMLKAENISIEAISEKLSFSDPRHFSSLFLKHVGCRPSAYRKQFK